MVSTNDSGHQRPLSGENTRRNRPIQKGRVPRTLTKGATERTLIEVNQLIGEAAIMALSGVAAEGYRISWELENDLALVKANKIQIQQVVVNLLRNSVEALAQT